MTILIVVLCLVVKRVNTGLAFLPNDGSAIEVRRDAESATGATLAIRAVTHAVQRRQCVDGDRSLPAGASGSHVNLLIEKSVAPAMPNV